MAAKLAILIGIDMNYTALDDENLIWHVAEGRPEALSALYDRYARLLFSLAYRAVGDAETAEEIVEDVFVSVWDKAATYRADQAKLSTWLVSITRYRAIDALRRRGARPDRKGVDWEAADPAALPRIDGPEQVVEQHAEQQRVRAAVAALPEDQRQVLSLAFFEGQTHSQIAASLGQPLGTVKTRIRLAMSKLRQMLQDERLTVQ
ncbi:MAG: sigma-70 family RNA polymerase sigma factor [Chloroflexota bacterium]